MAILSISSLISAIGHMPPPVAISTNSVSVDDVALRVSIKPVPGILMVVLAFKLHTSRGSQRDTRHLGRNPRNIRNSAEA